MTEPTLAELLAAIRQVGHKVDHQGDVSDMLQQALSELGGLRELLARHTSDESRRFAAIERRLDEQGQRITALESKVG